MTSAISGYGDVECVEYRNRIRARTMYDWAVSAFATTILAAALPVLDGQVAGRKLGSTGRATISLTATLSTSLIVLTLIVDSVNAVWNSFLDSIVTEDRRAAREADEAAAVAGIVESD